VGVECSSAVANSRLQRRLEALLSASWPATGDRWPCRCGPDCRPRKPERVLRASPPASNDPSRHRLLTAAPAHQLPGPLLTVVHESSGIRHGSITTLHDVHGNPADASMASPATCAGPAPPAEADPHHHRIGPGIGLIFPDLAASSRPLACGVAFASTPHSPIVVLELGSRLDAGQVEIAAF